MLYLLIIPTGDDTAATLTIKCASLTKSNLLGTAFLLHSFRLQESKYDTHTSAEGIFHFIQKSYNRKILSCLIIFAIQYSTTQRDTGTKLSSALI